MPAGNAGMKGMETAMMMTKDEAAGRMETLRTQIAYHQKRYYDEDAPEISDAE